MAGLKGIAEPSLAALQLVNDVLFPLSEPVVVLDPGRGIALANRAARDRFGMAAHGPASQTAQFVAPAGTHTIEVSIDIAGQPFTAVIFPNAEGDNALHERRLLAFARTAARAACMGSLQSTLDALAADVLDVTAAVTCTVIVTDSKTGAISVFGGAGDPTKHLIALEEARRRGAPLLTLAAAMDRRPRVERNIQRLVRTDHRFAPLAPIVEEGQWTSLVAAPLIVRDATLGAVTAYYSDSTVADEAEVGFIGAMADQAAVAVNTAMLFAELEAKAMLEERHRLARDLHDSVAQNLYSLVLHSKAAQVATGRVAGGDGTDVTERLTTISTLAEAALADMRAAIKELRVPGAGADSGLAAGVRKHAAAVAKREGVEVRISVPPEPILLSVPAEQELFWTVAEALTNSVRHAQATSVEIAIAAPTERELSVSVSDNGIGFDPSKDRPGHVGLASMRERVERLGGRLTVQSSSKGTVVCAVVPYRSWPRQIDQ
jgi:signal transduction histidine kinase